MGRIALGRVTLLSATFGLVLAQGVSGCGSASTPDHATGGKGAAGSPDDGGTPGESGGVGASAGVGESGSPGETGGTENTGGTSGAAGASFGGRGGSAGFSSGGVGGGRGGSGGRASGGNVSGGTAGVSGGSSKGGFAGAISGGAGGFAGLPNTGGTAVFTGGTGSGGGPSCLEGAPCTCKGDATGTTSCSAEGPTCECPPVEECSAKADVPCFEPCGGDPFGAWVLEESCFGRTVSQSNGSTCRPVLQGEDKGSDVRLRILDGGTLELFGHEDWQISAQVGLSCLAINTVKKCQFATYWPESLLFGSSGPAKCQENACGVCDCEGALNSFPSQFSFDRWSRSGKTLQLGFISVPYCVKGDELWIGGSDSNGTAKVSYKFKKQSCQGTPLACSKRTPEQCVQGFSCSPGACHGASGSVPRCLTAGSESECSVLQGCEWDPDGCTGAPNDHCEFASCGSEPGCTWGPPQQRCGGYPFPCEDRDVTQCSGGGCTPHVCQPNGVDYGSCQQLVNATDCGKAPGCTWASNVCTGSSLCAAQTDAAVCQKLSCWPSAWCGGTPNDCTTLSLDTCYDTPGCRIEW
jgi:hypothetical protein